MPRKSHEQIGIWSIAREANALLVRHQGLIHLLNHRLAIALGA